MYNSTAITTSILNELPKPNSLIYWYWGHSNDLEAYENQLLGKYWPGSNKVFRVVNCIQNEMYGT